MFGKCVFSKVLVVVLLLAGLTVSAAEVALVTTDSAMVYRKPNFDAQVLGYLKSGRKITVSSKKFGGAFHRLRLKQGVLAYISDVDIRTSGKAKDKSDSSVREAEEEKPKAPKRNLPPVGRTYLGIVGGVTKYSEILNKTEYSEQTATFGLKLTTPFGLMDGPFLLDIQIHGSSKPPGYYTTLSETPPSGYFLLSNFQLIYPLMEFAGRRGIVYFGGGPVIAYSSFLVERNNSKLPLDEVRAGAMFSAGMGFDMGGSLIFKIEPKYYVEKTSYNGFDLALQFSF